MICIFNSLTLQAQVRVPSPKDVPPGIYTFDSVDLKFIGLNRLLLVRHYQSKKQNGAPITNGPFGYGTSLGLYSLKARRISADRIAFMLPTGGTQYFISTDQITYKNETRNDPFQGIVSVMNNHLIFKDSSNTKLKFNRGTGNLEELINSFDETLFTLSWNDQKLLKVTEALGAAIHFVYEDTHYPDQVSMAYLTVPNKISETKVFYTYDPLTGDLTRFKDAMGKSTFYTYSNHQMKTVKTPDGAIKTIDLD